MSNNNEAKLTSRAFRVGPVFMHQKKFRVSSIATYHSMLLVGASDGSLRVFEMLDKNQIAFRESNYIQGFGGKEVEQLTVVEFEGIDLLISLADEHVQVHELPDFKLLCKLQKSKGAYLFAVNRSPHQDVSSDPKFASFLCLSIAVKRRVVMIYNWDPSAKVFLHKVEFGLPDTVSSMDWAGRWICLGFNRREYNLIHFGSGSNRPIFPVGKKGMPVSTLLPEREILLAKDNLGICVDYEGKPTRQDAIIWSEIPVRFAYHHPYVIGVLQTCVEVRNIHSRSLVQKIPFKEGKFVTIEGGLFVASATSLHAFIPIALHDQLETLVAAKEFKEALTLINMSRDSDWKSEGEKHARINQINTIHAYELFNKGDYQSSMMYFQQTDVNPRQILALFPDVLPSGQISVFEHPVTVNRITGEENLLQARSALIPFLEMMRGKLLVQKDVLPSSTSTQPNALVQTSNTPAITEHLQPGEMSLPALVDTVLLKSYLIMDKALVMPFLQQGSRCDIEKSSFVLQSFSMFKELVCLYHSRGLHLAALELLKIRGKGLAGSALYGTEPTILYLQELSEHAQDPDTIKLILDFSKWVLEENPEEGLRIFTHCHETGKVQDGIPPFTVLEHLKACSDRDVCILYLESLVAMGETNPFFHDELIFLYLDGVTSLMGIKGGDGKQQASIDASGKPNDSGQTQIPPTYEAKKMSVEEQGKKRVPAGQEPGRLGILRGKMMDILKSSVHYTPEKMLGWFPRDELLEERAILLSRINQHVQALTIYAHKLHDPEIAEAYCGEYYNEEIEEEKNMYLHLLKVYLQPPEDLQPRVEPLVQPALDLLAKHYDRIESIEALKILPATTSIEKLMPFFRNVLTSIKHRRRTNQVMKNLLTAEHRRVRLDNLRAGKPRILLDQDTTCVWCKKKIGGHSAFARYPDGKIIHYVCFKVAS